MSFKNISNFVLLFLLIILYSCKSIDILTDKNTSLIDYKDIKEKDLKINYNTNLNTKKNYFDYYDKLIIQKWNPKKDLVKVRSIKAFENSYEESNALIPIIYQNNLILLNYKSELKFYNIDSNKLNLLKKIQLKSDKINKLIKPSSIAIIDDKLYIAYVNGTLLKINLDGDILWSKNFKDIMKSPLKVFNDNLIILLSDKIMAIDFISGNINWEFVFKNNKMLNYLGGNIIENNQYLIFILPNNKFVAIDTIFGEEIKLNFKNIVNITDNKLNIYNNNLSLLDENKYLSNLDINTNILNLNKVEILNINSSYFFNNAILTLHKDGYLKSYNTLNKKIFWSVDVSSIINKKDKIIDISNYKESLLIFFKSGNVLELNSINGDIKSLKNTKTKKVIKVNSYNELLFLTQINGNMSIFLK